MRVVGQSKHYIDDLWEADRASNKHACKITNHWLSDQQFAGAALKYLRTLNIFRELDLAIAAALGSVSHQQVAVLSAAFRKSQHLVNSSFAKSDLAVLQNDQPAAGA